MPSHVEAAATHARAPESAAEGAERVADGVVVNHLRPAYHFTPRRNWMNDPNGLVWLDGTWHMFFQYNPFGADWGNMSWGHAVSGDLATWRELAPAITATRDEHVFSGSAVLDVDNTSGFGRDGPPLVAVYTSVTPDGVQAQSIAVSHDRGATFTRYVGNPVLTRGSRSFRDPKVFRYRSASGEGWWVMVAVEAEDETVLVFRSDDFKNWREVGQFRASSPEGVLWECPDLFQLPVLGSPGESAWVLVVSVNPGGPAGGSGTRYLVGGFDGEWFTPRDPDGWQWLDHGHDMYAAVSFANVPDERRVLIGWMSNWAYADVVPTAPWRGAMTVPREVRLERRPGGLVLTQRVPDEIDLWQADPRAAERVGMTVSGRVEVARASRARLALDIDPRGARAVGLEVFAGDSTRSVLSYDVERAVLRLERSASGATDFHPVFAAAAAQAPVPLRAGRLVLEVFLDGSTIEVFADDGAVTMTELVLPAAGDDRIVLVADGGDVRVHRLEVQRIRV